MSYEIVKSVNIKKGTITSASNNVYPKDWGTWAIKLTGEDFIKSVLLEFHYGNFHGSGDHTWKFEYASIVFRKDYSKKNEQLMHTIWEDSNASPEDKEKAQKELESALFEIYNSLGTRKGDFVVKVGSYYVVRANRKTGSYSYVSSKEYRQVKHFHNYDKACWYAHKLTYYNNGIDFSLRLAVEDELGLPDRKYVSKTALVDRDADVQALIEDDSIGDILGDYLSDRFGFCHKGFEFIYNEAQATFAIYNIKWDATE